MMASLQNTDWRNPNPCCEVTCDTCSCKGLLPTFQHMHTDKAALSVKDPGQCSLWPLFHFFHVPFSLCFLLFFWCFQFPSGYLSLLPCRLVQNQTSFWALFFNCCRSSVPLIFHLRAAKIEYPKQKKSNFKTAVGLFFPFFALPFLVVPMLFIRQFFSFFHVSSSPFSCCMLLCVHCFMFFDGREGTFSQISYTKNTVVIFLSLWFVPSTENAFPFLVLLETQRPVPLTIGSVTRWMPEILSQKCAAAPRKKSDALRSWRCSSCRVVVVVLLCCCVVLLWCWFVGWRVACGVWRGGVVAWWRGVAWRGVAWRGVAWRGVAWRGVAWRGVAWRGVAWRGVAWRGVAWRGVAWRGVAWRGVAWRGVFVCLFVCLVGWLVGWLVVWFFGCFVVRCSLSVVWCCCLVLICLLIGCLSVRFCLLGPSICLMCMFRLLIA